MFLKVPILNFKSRFPPKIAFISATIFLVLEGKGKTKHENLCNSAHSLSHCDRRIPISSVLAMRRRHEKEEAKQYSQSCTHRVKLPNSSDKSRVARTKKSVNISVSY